MPSRGAAVLSFQAHAGPVLALAFSPDGGTAGLGQRDALGEDLGRLRRPSCSITLGNAHADQVTGSSVQPRRPPSRLGRQAIGW